jgi:predicted dehydrogenase
MVKFGAIGAGMISQSGFDGLTASGSAEVVAVADIHAGRAKEYADRNKVKKYYTEAASIIKDDSIDAVYIALPNALHVPMAVAALEAGKHVILDKPFALNFAEATKVADAVKKTGKLFMLGMNQRFAEGPQRIKALVDRGYFGDIYAVGAYWRRRGGIPRLGTWFGNKAGAGGGCMLDIGVHMLDLALYTIGNFEVESVSGSIFTRFGDRGLGEGGWGISDRENPSFDVDDFATAFIRLKGGVVLNLNVSWAAHQKEIDIHNVDLHGTTAGASLYPGEVYSYDSTAKANFDMSDLKIDIKYPHCDRFVNFVRAILGEEAPGVTIDQALAVQRTLDAVYQSAEEGREIRLGRKA